MSSKISIYKILVKQTFLLVHLLLSSLYITVNPLLIKYNVQTMHEGTFNLVLLVFDVKLPNDNMVWRFSAVPRHCPVCIIKLKHRCNIIFSGMPGISMSNIMLSTSPSCVALCCNILQPQRILGNHEKQYTWTCYCWHGESHNVLFGLFRIS